jgi:hypothetical protein
MAMAVAPASPSSPGMGMQYSVPMSPGPLSPPPAYGQDKMPGVSVSTASPAHVTAYMAEEGVYEAHGQPVYASEPTAQYVSPPQQRSELG